MLILITYFLEKILLEIEGGKSVFNKNKKFKHLENKMFDERSISNNNTNSCTNNE